MKLIDILYPPPHLLKIPDPLAVRYGPDWTSSDRGEKEPLDEKIEDVLRGGEWLTVAQIGAIICSPDDSIRRALGRLIRDGMVAAKGKKPGIKYAWADNIVQ